MQRRVVITGVGLVSPLGVGTEVTWDGLVSARSGIGPVTRFDASSFPVRIAGEVPSFSADPWLEPKEQRKYDTFVHYAVAAADFAMKMAEFSITSENAERVGVVIGSGIGGLRVITDNYSAYLEKGPRRISPFFIPGSIVNMPAGLVSIRFGAKGPNSATCTACSTGAHAIGDAFLYIQRGYCDAALAGGSESVIEPLSLGGFASMKALSTRNEEPEKASRPWDRDRDGFVMGEGSGVLLLEAYESAMQRGAPILCEVLGFGMSGDAYHITAPSEDGSGGAAAIRMALAEAQVNPQEVDYINAHGTATDLNDASETRAIKAAFGDLAYNIPVSSTKSMTGHMMGATGALEAIFCVQTIRESLIPPTLHYETPDPDCDLDYVPNHARQARVKVALSNAFGFGGHNAVLVIREYS